MITDKAKTLEDLQAELEASKALNEAQAKELELKTAQLNGNTKFAVFEFKGTKYQFNAPLINNGGVIIETKAVSENPNDHADLIEKLAGSSILKSL